MEVLISLSSKTSDRFSDLVVTVLDWPASPVKRSGEYYQEEDERHQTQQHRRAEGRYESNLGFHRTSAVPQADRLNATTY